MTRRLAFVSPRFLDGRTAVGGAETLLRALAEYAAADGVTVDFLTTCARNHFTWENEIPAGQQSVGKITVHYFPVDTNRDIDTFLRLQGAICRRQKLDRTDELLWLKHSVNSQALCDYLRRSGDKYDWIILGPYLFGLTYFASQVRPERSLLVPCLHDEPFAYLDVMGDWFRQCPGFLFNSVPEKELAQRLFGTDPARGHVVGMGITDFTADKTAFAARHGLKAPYVLYSGRREAMKGTPLLLNYLDVWRARTGRDVRLVLTGSGPVDIPPALVPYVLDVGVVSEDEKREAMAGALVFCHPSVNESFGIVLLEAWLAATPALVHAGSAVLRYQCERSGGGLWFRSYPEFEEELLLLLENSALRQDMAAAGRRYVLGEYSWPAVGRRFFGALKKIGAAG